MNTNLHTLGELKASGYRPRSIKDELRENLIQKLRTKETLFEGILGFDDTVLPDIQRAVLSRHNFLLLGLRGQAKTRIARAMVNILDEYMPVVNGSELNDDPMQPISRYAIELVAEKGDATPIVWVHRSERFVEKLATPDVSVADLIGDVDPIKAAALKLSYADERVIHYGLLPRANRCIFVINELPDLQARIQVALFNALQEKDIQIRGFKVRLPLDVQFVFTANPEDYTNRGSIITPLKDRIESQILTHYPIEIEVSKAITQQEARLSASQKETVYVPDILQTLIEEIAFVARDSEFIDENSGVSARLSISAYENLVSAAERRMLINGEAKTTARLTDFWGIIPAITGKIELVYEGEQEGPYQVALNLINAAIKKQFLEHFPNPDKLQKNNRDPYDVIRAFFGDSHKVDVLSDATNEEYEASLNASAGLRKMTVKEAKPAETDILTFMELALHGLAEFSVLSKDILTNSFTFSDNLGDLLDDLEDELDDEEDDDDDDDF
jgi:magnesium chelatase subunit I